MLGPIYKSTENTVVNLYLFNTYGQSLAVNVGVTVDLKTPSGETIKTLGQQAFLMQPDEHATGVRMIIAVKDYVIPYVSSNHSLLLNLIGVR